jgi:phosphatidate cytidylyltransferase
MASSTSSLSNLQIRILVAIAGIAVFMGMLWIGWEGTIALFAGILALSLWEFYGLSPFRFPLAWKLLGTMLGIGLFFFLLVISMEKGPGPFRLLFFLSPILLILLVFSKIERPFETLSWMVGGWFYLVTPWICMVLMVLDATELKSTLLGLFGLLWMADSGAYFAGRSLGKNKLLPRVSPKKTWEGLAGGLAAALLLAWGLGQFFSQDFSPQHWLVLAVSTTLAGTLGDLAESVLKRSLDLKDSGSLLPGHGGFLDRFDGLFVAAPVNLIIMTFFF